jgi:hypothetical protein
MNCFPSCEVSLPKTGKAFINSKLDICKSPTVLTLSINSDGKRSVSSFVAGNQQEYRTIGNEYWPLQLQVKFRNAADGGYYADACIQTVRTGNTTCFMSGFIDGSVDSGCGNHRAHNNNGFPIIILCVILATCLLMVSVAVIAMFHRLYTSHKSKDTRKPSYCNRKVSNGSYPTFFDPSFNNPCNKYPHDERLAVIDEVDERDNDCISVASTGFDSGHVRSVSEDEWTRHTDLSTDTRIVQIPPLSSTTPGENRRQSQPLVHAFSPTLNTFKPRHSLPFVQNSFYV